MASIAAALVSCSGSGQNLAPNATAGGFEPSPYYDPSTDTVRAAVIRLDYLAKATVDDWQTGRMNLTERERTLDSLRALMDELAPQLPPAG
ncbi:hypothetical protein A3850_009580 [Lewinella sp. 4G2]|nr:hypothetical protein A3850_009580 [Lewinella sp. 4G2]